MGRKKQVGRGNQQDQSNQDKRKPIKKEQKPKKEKKNGNSNNKARRGRPPESEPIIVEDDPAQNVQEHLLQYLDNIGLRHGLVFRKQERQKLKQKVRSIEWKDDHSWDERVERQKLVKNEKLMRQIDKSIQLSNYPYEQAKDLYIDTIINIGDIAAEECTSQIYRLIAEILESINLEQSIEEQEQKAINLFDSTLFLSGRFGYECQSKYWIQIDQSKEGQNRNHFVDMFKKEVNSVRQMFNDLEKIRKFEKEQKQMNQKLRQIIQKSQFKKTNI